MLGLDRHGAFPSPEFLNTTQRCREYDSDAQEKVNSYYIVQRDGAHVSPSQLANDSFNARATCMALQSDHTSTTFLMDANHELY